MSKKSKIFLAVYFLLMIKIYAQQDPQFTHNYFNRVGVNPGAAGLNKAVCTNLFLRQQWTNFTAAPQTGLLTVDMAAFDNKPMHGGLGFIVGVDKQGFENTLNARLGYAYHLKLGNGTLGLGFDAGVINYSLKAVWLAPDGTSGISDLSIPQSSLTSTNFDLGLGAFYNSDNFYFGLSSTHIPATTLKASVNNKNFKYTLVRHFYVNTGFNYDINQKWSLKPNILIKATTAAITVDVNALLFYNNAIWAGLNYRTTDAISALIGINYKTFKIGYSYDYTTSKLNTSRGGSSNGTHEIFVGYCLLLNNPAKLNVQRSRTVRFL